METRDTSLTAEVEGQVLDGAIRVSAMSFEYEGVLEPFNPGIRHVVKGRMLDHLQIDLEGKTPRREVVLHTTGCLLFTASGILGHKYSPIPREPALERLVATFVNVDPNDCFVIGQEADRKRAKGRGEVLIVRPGLEAASMLQLHRSLPHGLEM
jgi:hypothetical protein